MFGVLKRVCSTQDDAHKHAHSKCILHVFLCTVAAPLILSFTGEAFRVVVLSFIEGNHQASNQENIYFDSS